MSGNTYALFRSLSANIFTSWCVRSNYFVISDPQSVAKSRSNEKKILFSRLFIADNKKVVLLNHGGNIVNFVRTIDHVAMRYNGPFHDISLLCLVQGTFGLHTWLMILVSLSQTIENQFGYAHEVKYTYIVPQILPQIDLKQKFTFLHLTLNNSPSWSLRCTT